MKSFRTASLADQVFEKLEDDIVYGVYKRGEILTELKLAEALGVSRTPIREALRRLEQERMIEPRTICWILWISACELKAWFVCTRLRILLPRVLKN